MSDIDSAQYVRHKDHPLNPLFPGILRGAAMESTLQSATFEFLNSLKCRVQGVALRLDGTTRQGLSGSDAQHVLEILFLKPVGSYLFCLEHLRSDTFSIYSSRRATTQVTVKPEAEAYENDEDVDDDRGQKRKRAFTRASPASSTKSTSPTASPPQYFKFRDRVPIDGDPHRVEHERSQEPPRAPKCKAHEPLNANACDQRRLHDGACDEIQIRKVHGH